VCDASESDAVVNGDVHVASAPASTWHLNVDGSFAVNAMAGVASLPGFAGGVIVTTGTAVSTVNVFEAFPVLPAVSVATTLMVCEPSDSAGGTNGEVQLAAALVST
jgi:hypothetical protein